MSPLTIQSRSSPDSYVTPTGGSLPWNNPIIWWTISLKRQDRHPVLCRIYDSWELHCSSEIHCYWLHVHPKLWISPVLAGDQALCDYIVLGEGKVLWHLTLYCTLPLRIRDLKMYTIYKCKYFNAFHAHTPIHLVLHVGAKTELDQIRTWWSILHPQKLLENLVPYIYVQGEPGCYHMQLRGTIDTICCFLGFFRNIFTNKSIVVLCNVSSTTVWNHGSNF